MKTVTNYSKDYSHEFDSTTKTMTVTPKSKKAIRNTDLLGDDFGKVAKRK